MLEPPTLDIFQAVRRGDIETVRYLVEVQAETLQQHDDWDATPLYYAARAGNKELVKYLLSVGARCEEKTFDGERCLYAALNDDVRRLLLDEGFKRAGARGHDLFLDFLGKAFNVPEAYPDLIVSFDEETVYAHKFLLVVRAPAVGRVFGDSWKHQVTHFQAPSSSSEAVLQYLLPWFYTCRLDVPFDAVPAAVELCQRAQLSHLVAEADSTLNSEAGKIMQHLPFRGSSLVVEPPREVAKQQLQDCLQHVVNAGCSNLLQSCGDQAAADSQTDYFFDLKLVLGQTSCLCHRSFMSRRSDYFSTMLGSSFQEGLSAPRDMLEIQVTDVEPPVLYAALHWVYTDRVDADMPAQQLLQVMQYADRALMEGLKGRCAMLLHPHVTQDSALPLLQQALAMDSDRLTETCVRCIAQHLLVLVREPLFHQLVKESAASVQNREDVDSVPIVDDIRYHVTLLHGDGELSDDEEDLDVLDPAQLASAHASQQQPQQHQQHQEQQQQPQLYIHCQERHSCRQYCTRQAPNKLQSGAISKEMQFPDWQLLDEPSGWLDEQQEEKLIRMDDPLFSSLSERRQKLMALEEILLNTGIEG
ncbi:Ankyrin repeat and BTB/POZ domain-containing protein 1 [Trebouxia sp. C0010 RCD-2024]